MDLTTITVTGHSDDLIEVEGAIREEFDAYDEIDGSLLAFSNGIVLRVRYDEQGVWRITVVAGQQSAVTVVQAPEGDEENYSDVATLPAASWVVRGKDIAYRERGSKKQVTKAGT